jgi:broad specificity phosphatase PhoE
MTMLALVRHGPTEWNEGRLVQGRSDIALSAAGRAEVETWRLPPDFASFDWVASPLRRARETAEILYGAPVPTDERLVEMDWADWEGRRLEDLRAEIGNLMTAWEARGLDFRAPGGESPREVQARLRPFLAERARAKRPTVAVCHRGVIRAVYALAIAWDMTSKAPRRLADGCAQIFTLAEDGMPSVHTLDRPLDPGSP